jgi:hypothetical protein
MLYISQYILAKLSYVLAEYRSSKVSGMYMHERAAQLNQLDLELSETIVMLQSSFHLSVGQLHGYCRTTGRWKKSKEYAVCSTRVKPSAKLCLLLTLSLR